MFDPHSSKVLQPRRLHEYDFRIAHISRNANTADLLSCLPSKFDDHSDSGFVCEGHVRFVCTLNLSESASCHSFRNEIWSKAPGAAHGWIAQSQVYFCLEAKRVFVRNYWYENMSPVGSFAWKSRHFHVTFSTSTHSEANSNSEVEVRSACIWKCQAAHQASTYSSFCSIRWLEVFLLLPGWDASPSQGYPQHLIC